MKAYIMSPRDPSDSLTFDDE